jgi:predicted  nucleic acid-binding Zn ribbon protein
MYLNIRSPATSPPQCLIFSKIPAGALFNFEHSHKATPNHSATELEKFLAIHSAKCGTLQNSATTLTVFVNTQQHQKHASQMIYTTYLNPTLNDKNTTYIPYYKTTPLHKLQFL